MDSCNSLAYSAFTVFTSTNLKLTTVYINIPAGIYKLSSTWSISSIINHQIKKNVINFL